MNDESEKGLPVLWTLGFGLFILFGLLTLLSVPAILDRGTLEETRQEFAAGLEQALADPAWSYLNDLAGGADLRRQLKTMAADIDPYLPVWEKYVLQWKGRDFLINFFLGLLLTAAGIAGLRRKPLAVPLTAAALTLATLWAGILLLRSECAIYDLIALGLTQLRDVSLLRPVCYWSLALIALLHAGIAYDVWKRRSLLESGVDQRENHE